MARGKIDDIKAVFKERNRKLNNLKKMVKRLLKLKTMKEVKEKLKQEYNLTDEQLDNKLVLRKYLLETTRKCKNINKNYPMSLALGIETSIIKKYI